MTYEEVFEKVHDNCYECDFSVPCDKEKCDTYLILKALNKQIPKKPKIYEATPELTVGFCVECGKVVYSDREYCSNCGQRQDRSKE